MSTGALPRPQAATDTWIQPFQGEDPHCPKCGAGHLQTEYHSTAVVGFCKEDRDKLIQLAEDPDSIEDELTEHLCRGCQRCGYAWREHVAPPGWKPSCRKADDE